MKTRRTACLAAAVWLFLLLAVAGLLAAAWYGLSWLDRANAIFGPPAAGLDLGQRLRLSAQLLLQAEQLTQPANPGGERQPFEIELGETVATVADRLQSAGLIRDAGAFRLYLVYSGLDTTLQAGQYDLSPAQTPLEIAWALQDATPGEVTFSVLAGWRLEEVAASIPTSGLAFTAEEFLQAASRAPAGVNFIPDLPDEASLEGFLFPGAYLLPRQLSAPQVLVVLLNAFAVQFTPEIQRGCDRQGLSAYEAVTLAAIVEREAVIDAEMPLIASVFYNRLAAGMPLEADSTAQYALGYNQEQETWWTNPLSAADLEVASPYNTYRASGLPPGPIANPSLSALRAVAFPAQTPYYFFRAACDNSGKHLFAQTYQEHVGNECR